MENNRNSGDNLLTTTEASSLLRVSDETIIALAKAGKIQAFKVGKNWRINRKSLEAYINSTNTMHLQHATIDDLIND
jgi:excisionase family DNA binding protein